MREGLRLTFHCRARNGVEVKMPQAGVGVGGDAGSPQKWVRAATHYLLCVGYRRSASDLRRGFVGKLPGFF